MTDMARRAKTALILELLDESFRHDQDGDRRMSDICISEAMEIDVAAVAIIRGGIVLGEIPNPATDYAKWHEYVMAAQAFVRPGR